MNGFIVLQRKILKWGWYHDTNTVRVFIHCLLMANYEDNKFRNRVIKRGSFVTSLSKLKQQTNLTIQQIRTALEHLKSTNEITIETTSRFSIITINNYSLYQDYDKPSNNQATSKQQTSNKQITTTNNITKKQINNITNNSIYAQSDKIEPVQTDIFIEIPLNDKTEYPITFDLVKEYKKLYPAVNVESELRKYRAWSLSNPTKRKTRRGILRSINLWLSREQDKGKKSNSQDLPKWFGKEISTDEITEEEQKELEKILREIGERYE